VVRASDLRCAPRAYKISLANSIAILIVQLLGNGIPPRRPNTRPFNGEALVVDALRSGA